MLSNRRIQYRRSSLPYWIFNGWQTTKDTNKVAMAGSRNSEGCYMLAGIPEGGHAAVAYAAVAYAAVACALVGDCNGRQEVLLAEEVTCAPAVAHR